jgi:hypothetical protein
MPIFGMQKVVDCPLQALVIFLYMVLDATAAPATPFLRVGDKGYSIFYDDLRRNIFVDLNLSLSGF